MERRPFLSLVKSILFVLLVSVGATAFMVFGLRSEAAQRSRTEETDSQFAFDAPAAPAQQSADSGSPSEELDETDVEDEEIEEEETEEEDAESIDWLGTKQTTIVDAATGRPIEGAQAWIIACSTKKREVRGGISDGFGDVALHEASCRSAALMVKKPGYVTHFDWIGGRWDREVPKTVTLTSGQPLRGTVLLPGDRPAAGARVYAWDEKERTEINHDAKMVDPYDDAFLVCDAQGRFEIGAVAAERPVILSVVVPGYAGYHAIHGPQQDLVVRVGIGGVVEGRVFDSAGLPVVEADVYVEREEQDGDYNFGIIWASGATTQTVTDGDGRYRVVGVPLQGRYVVTASADYWARGASESFALREGNARQWRDVRVEKGAGIKVRLASTTDRPAGAPRLDCDLTHFNGQSVWSRYWSNSYTTSKNKFERDGLHAGSYWLKVRLGDRIIDTRVVDLQSGEELELVVRDGTLD